MNSSGVNRIAARRPPIPVNHERRLIQCYPFTVRLLPTVRAAGVATPCGRLHSPHSSSAARDGWIGRSGVSAE
jgi:hypothetical protein